MNISNALCRLHMYVTPRCILASVLLRLTVFMPCSVHRPTQSDTCSEFITQHLVLVTWHLLLNPQRAEQKHELAKAKNSHFVGRSSFRLPRFLCGIVRLLSLSFSESCSSWLGRNPFSWERLRLCPWGLEEGLLGIPFSTSLSSCLRKQASDVLSLCPPMSLLWTSAMDGLPTPV